MNIKFINNKNKYLRRNQISNTKKIKYNNLIFLFLCFLLLCGVIYGSSYFQKEFSDNYIEENNNPFFDNKLLVEEIEKKELFIDSIFQNMLILIFFWIIGLSIIGVPLLIFYLFYEGISIGITISYVLTYLDFYMGYGFLYTSMYITSLINVFSMLFLCYSAICVTFNVLKKSKDIKYEFIRHSCVCLIALILFLGSSFIEVYMLEIGKNVIYMQ